MKKLVFLIIGVVLIITACKKNDRETNFIPTTPPDFTGEELDFPSDELDVDVEPAETPDNSEDDVVDVSETTTKYVKLSTYGAILNVRSSPSTEEDNIVGFLVHTEPVEVISIENNWAKFLYNGEIRYVSADYLVDTIPPYVSPPNIETTPAPTPTLTPTPTPED